MALNKCKAAATDEQGRELAAHGTPLFPVACYHDDLRETPVPWHWHEECEALVIEAGAARGFQEMSYFARTFRQIQGCTPGAYRRAEAEVGERPEV